MKALFVYVDRTSDGVPFYVGKGDARRCRQLKRNAKHTAITAKYGQVRTIEFETTDLASVNSEEIRLIAMYQTCIVDNSDNKFACNFTRGGEGQSGYNWRPDQKQNARDAWTPEMKELHRIKQTIIQNDAVVKNKMLTAMQITINSPEVRQRFVTSMSDPEMRRQHRLSCKEAQNRPETKQKMRDALLKESTKQMLLHYDEICARIKTGEIRQALAVEFGVSYGTMKKHFRGVK